MMNGIAGILDPVREFDLMKMKTIIFRCALAIVNSTCHNPPVQNRPLLKTFQKHTIRKTLPSRHGNQADTDTILERCERF